MSNAITWVLPLLLVTNALLGFWRFTKPEIYPFYSWDMFSIVPETSSRASLVVHGTERAPLDPALSFEEAAARGLLSRQLDVTVHHMLARWAWAETHGRAESAEKERRYVETALMKPGLVYDLVVDEQHPFAAFEGEAPTRRVLRRMLVAGAP